MNDSDFKIDHSKMEYFFNPRTIAIIGASSDFRKPGGRSLNALQKRGYTGKIYPINPNSRELLGIPRRAEA